MIVVGEKINASRRAIARALARRDAQTIARCAKGQVAAGADYLDINGGDAATGQEARNVAWLVDVVREAVSVPLCIDTADADAARVGLERAGARTILNSITLERERLAALLPVIERHACDVVALTMGDDGPPSGVDDRLRAAMQLTEILVATGRDLGQIYIDPCVLPVSVDPSQGPVLMEAIAAIRNELPGVHIIGGISNISYGLPQRYSLNLAALSQAIEHGMDAVIADPTTPGLMGIAYAAHLLTGGDEHCMAYIAAGREGILK